MGTLPRLAGNVAEGMHVWTGVAKRMLLGFTLAAALLLPAAQPDYQAVLRKFSLIEHDRLKPGARVVLTPQ